MTGTKTTPSFNSSSALSSSAFSPIAYSKMDNIMKHNAIQQRINSLTIIYENLKETTYSMDNTIMNMWKNWVDDNDNRFNTYLINYTLDGHNSRMNERLKRIDNLYDHIYQLEKERDLINIEEDYINKKESETETEQSETETEQSETETEQSETKYLLNLNKEDEINKLRLHLYNYSFYGFNVPTMSNKYGFDIYEFKESLIKYIDEDNETLKYLLDMIELYDNYKFNTKQQEEYKKYIIRYKFIYDKLDDYKILINDGNDANYINDLMALIYIMIEEPHIEDINELIKLIYTCVYRHITVTEDLTDQEGEPETEEEEESEDEQEYHPRLFGRTEEKPQTREEEIIFNSYQDIYNSYKKIYYDEGFISVYDDINTHTINNINFYRLRDLKYTYNELIDFYDDIKNIMNYKNIDYSSSSLYKNILDAVSFTIFIRYLKVSVINVNWERLTKCNGDIKYLVGHIEKLINRVDDIYYCINNMKGFSRSHLIKLLKKTHKYNVMNLEKFTHNLF